MIYWSSYLKEKNGWFEVTLLLFFLKKERHLFCPLFLYFFLTDQNDLFFYLHSFIFHLFDEHFFTWDKFLLSCEKKYFFFFQKSYITFIDLISRFLSKNIKSTQKKECCIINIVNKKIYLFDYVKLWIYYALKNYLLNFAFHFYLIYFIWYYT